MTTNKKVPTFIYIGLQLTAVGLIIVVMFI